MKSAYARLNLGVYTSLRTFEHNKFLWLDWHLVRLVRSMRALGWHYQLNEWMVRTALHKICSEYPGELMRVRIDVLPEAAEQLETESRLLIGLTNFAPPRKSLYQNGVRLGIARGLARVDPLVKQASFVERRRQYQAAETDIYEQLLVDDFGQILEGTSSNFFGVRQESLCTAEDGVLAGVTRAIILKLASEIGITTRLQGIHMDELASLDEAAISSSSRGLVPVAAIDGILIGNGKPGPVCQRLLTAYEQFVAKEIKTAIE